MALVLISTASCLPLAAWTAEGYTVDASKSSETASAVGHCFRLRADAEAVPGLRRIELRSGGALDVEGRLHVLTSPEASPPGRFNLPRGSTIVVERVLRWRNVETSVLTPYIRIDGAWIDAGDLFQGTTPIDRLLEPCEGTSKASGAG